MSQVNAKYLKDESNNIFSPVTSVDSIYKDGKHLLDFFYPVGTYYETSDVSFNPNTIWGGTWIQDTKGRVTVAAGECDDEEGRMYKLGDKIGRSTNWLTSLDQLPKHSLTFDCYTDYDGGHNHRLAMNLSDKDSPGNYDYLNYDGYGWSSYYNLTKYEGNHRHHISGTTSSVGSDSPVGFSIIQSSIVVIRWHRIA